MNRPEVAERTAARLRPARWAILGAAALLAASTTWIVIRSLTPTDGAPVVIDYGFAEGFTVEPVPGAPSLLRARDVVVAVEGMSINQVLLGASVRHPGLRAGAAWRYQIRVRLRRSDVRLTFRRPLETTTPDQFQS